MLALIMKPKSPQRHAMFLFSAITAMFGFLCYAIALVTPVSAQNNSVPTSMLFAEYVNALRDSVHSILSAVDSTVGNNLFRSRQHLELLLNQIEAIAKTISAKTMSDLSVIERNFFTDLEKQLNKLNSQLHVTLLDIEQLSANVSSGIRNLPFASSFPIIFQYDPLFVVDMGPDNRDNVTISIRGALLSSFEPTLTIDNEKCERIEKIDTSLSFICNKELFLANDTIVSYSGKLLVYQSRSFWRRLLLRDPLEYSYDISVEVIPQLLGKAKTTVMYEIMSAERNERTEDFHYLNGHCHGSIEKLFPFNASQGWKIDPTSIVANCRSSRNSTCSGFRNVQDRSFGYACRIQNRGRCGPLWRDARGSCGGTIRWEEVKENRQLQAQKLDEIELSWGEDTSIELPENTQRVRITLDRVDGVRSVLTESQAEDLWVQVEIDKAGNLVVLRPRDVETVMRLDRGM